MGWLLKSKASLCAAEDNTSKSKPDKEVLVKLGEAMNSSRQYPGLAAVFNKHQQESSRLQLLAMPRNILEKILRFAVVENAPICVAADHPEDCDERSRGILSICQAIRKIARPMYYQENTFEIQVFHFDIKAALRWLKMTEKFRRSTETTAINNTVRQYFGIRVKDEKGDNKVVSKDSSKAVAVHPNTAGSNGRKPKSAVVAVFGQSYDNFIRHPGISSRQIDMLDYFMSKLDRTLARDSAMVAGGLYIIAKYEPHWDNLVEWLRFFYAGEVARYPLDQPKSDFSFAVSGMFDLVEIEKHEEREWGFFRRRLDRLRGIMGEVDRRWL